MFATPHHSHTIPPTSGPLLTYSKEMKAYTLRLWTESLRVSRDKRASSKAAAKGQTCVQAKSH
ncbi:uncharacterized protein STEHIDRAFT_143728 [Stereum hirsutum FP-91666 SS1]|uniref:uncharacterized protein n=1 Tax=Stereum hirsutum (strain FP-91666) TaxID=721885 RepID=UPI000440AB15|nr:uncharacterized protein STEHIDRAFT_143728 [Stereum hirsutum FP-91666 SS1]EIM92335.1 hypothetical protein STEHIDRAFT_143728 [Stereum hirsutum FP-91666 SS1]